MVSRKPLPSKEEDSRPIPPYPVSPIATTFSTSTTNRQQPDYASHEQEDTTNPWQDVERPADISEGWEDTGRLKATALLPQPLRMHPPTPINGNTSSSDIPHQTRTGSRQLTPQSSWEKDSDDEVENPQHQSPFDAPPHAPPAPPAIVPSMTGLSDTNPYRAKSTDKVPQLPVPREDDNSNIWAEIVEDKPRPSSKPVPIAELDQLNLEDRPGWDIEPVQQTNISKQIDSPLIDLQHSDEFRQELEATPFGPPKGLEDLDHATANSKGKGLALEADQYQPPPGPPPSKSTTKSSDRKITVPEEVANKQRSETYQIKHIRWSDSNSHEIRTSPILTQNKNGPCPLMALVNALTLSTPPELNTALIETLRVREQISLGLLLDAVFDELMSGRRGDAAQGLPDVSELYAFLITLHTGMNVNPRFIPAKRYEQNLMDGEIDEIPPTAEDYLKPGSFEDTKEMMLYGTFSIPLIHGWLPPREHAAFQAIERSASTYEDAQNLMFREEELDDKVQSSGLSPEEQRLFEDIASIKYYLSSTATQLTEHGLDTINESLDPGSIAILFRNDHFSTLYKQPRTGQLLLLVTDAGYANHDEIVWESLVDVGGKGSEFLSGDFRPVGGNPAQSQAFEQSGTSSSDWQTVHSRQARKGNPDTSKPLPHEHEEFGASSSSRNHEQEDADLALAMQLQEEEEENSRRTAAQRRRQEEQASSQYLAQGGSNRQGQAAGGRATTSQNIQPLLPPRRNTAIANPRPAVHREEATSDDAPPSYEQASNSEPYHEPAAARPAANSPAQGSRPVPSNRPRGQSAYSVNSAQGGYPITPVNTRRRSGVPMMQQPVIGETRRRPSAEKRDPDCVVM